MSSQYIFVKNFKSAVTHILNQLQYQVMYSYYLVLDSIQGTKINVIRKRCLNCCTTGTNNACIENRISLLVILTEECLPCVHVYVSLR